MKYHLVSLSSDIVEDDYKTGEKEPTGCGLDKERIGKDFKTKKEMLKWLNQYYGITT